MAAKDNLSRLVKYVRENPEFRRYFEKSKAVDKEGNPLLVYHGTPSLAGITAKGGFDPALTGKGHDALGSGFYFTTNPAQANGFAWPNELGDTPGIVPAFLDIRNPLVVKDGLNLDRSDFSLTRPQAEKLISVAPDVRDPELTSLSNWFDTSSRPINDRMIREVSESYAGQPLGNLENDFYKGDSTAYRHALNKILGFDGVYGPIEDDLAHYVAWFPEQIKSPFNVGSFDRKDPRINYARGGLTALNKECTCG